MRKSHIVFSVLVASALTLLPVAAQSQQDTSAANASPTSSASPLDTTSPMVTTSPVTTDTATTTTQNYGQWGWLGLLGLLGLFGLRKPRESNLL